MEDTTEQSISNNNSERLLMQEDGILKLCNPHQAPIENHTEPKFGQFGLVSVSY